MYIIRLFSMHCLCLAGKISFGSGIKELLLGSNCYPEARKKQEPVGILCRDWSLSASTVRWYVGNRKMGRPIPPNYCWMIPVMIFGMCCCGPIHRCMPCHTAGSLSPRIPPVSLPAFCLKENIGNWFRLPLTWYWQFPQPVFILLTVSTMRYNLIFSRNIR